MTSKKDMLKSKLKFEVPPNDIKETSDPKQIPPEFAGKLDLRKTRKVIVNDEDFTPQLLKSSKDVTSWKYLYEKIEGVINRYATDLTSIKTHSIQKTDETFSRVTVNMDELTSQLSVVAFQSFDLGSTQTLMSKDEKGKIQKIKLPPFMKVTLKQTCDFVLFEKPSVTVLKDSEEAKAVIEDNKLYEYLTVGKGRNRRRNDAETQTIDSLLKSRTMNTIRTKKINVASFVSGYEMFDTYKNLALKKDESIEDIEEKPEEPPPKIQTISPIKLIAENPKFKLDLMFFERHLSSNNFFTQQKKFRGLFKRDPLSMDIKYYYTVNELWEFANANVVGKAVSSLSWCYGHGDILAVGYGAYTFLTHNERLMGNVLIWSIKNPVNPEKIYNFSVPVTAVAFSHMIPQLLAVGLYDGTVQVYDISSDSNEFIAISQRASSSEPINDIQWLTDEHDLSPAFLSVSQDGTIMKYSMTTGVFLVGFRQMKLDRVEGSVEGLPVHRNQIIPSDRYPQSFSLKIHPEKLDIYFVGTDEGCLHKCSLNYPQQHTDVLQVQYGCVFSLEFSPWCNKIFLTCGSDWYIRIWIEGIFEPIINLCYGSGPIHCAAWSETHSTIIMGLKRESVEIWDIRQSVFKPVSTHTFGSGANLLTVGRFSLNGRALVIGNEQGATYVCSLDDMPFPPHFQFDELVRSIFKALAANPELIQQVINAGFKV